MPTLTIESDKPVVVIPVDEYESLLETIEILSNPELVKDIEKARKEFREGKTIGLEKLRAELDVQPTEFSFSDRQADRTSYRIST